MKWGLNTWSDVHKVVLYLVPQMKTQSRAKSHLCRSQWEVHRWLQGASSESQMSLKSLTLVYLGVFVHVLMERKQISFNISFTKLTNNKVKQRSKERLTLFYLFLNIFSFWSEKVTFTVHYGFGKRCKTNCFKYALFPINWYFPSDFLLPNAEDTMVFIICCSIAP